MSSTFKILTIVLTSIGFLGCGGGSTSSQDESGTSQNIGGGVGDNNPPKPVQPIASSWHLSKNEFPESVVSASASEVSGYQSNVNALNVRYTFNCQKNCDGLVAIGQTINASDLVKLARIKMKSNADVLIGLRLTDADGQIIEYDGMRAFEASNIKDWHFVQFDLNKPRKFKNGLNDGKIHRGIKRAEVLIQAIDHLIPVPKQLIGDVTLAQLEMTETLNSTIGLSDARLANLKVAAKSSEIFGDRLGVAHEVILGEHLLASAKQAGLSFVRTDIYWELVESEIGQYDFSKYDSFFARLKKEGLGALIILDYGHPKYDVLTSAGRAGFIRYAKAVVNRYRGKGIKFEIWNEPNWSATNKQWIDNAAVFSAFCREVSAAIHEVDPNVLVTSGATSWFDMDYLAKMFTKPGDAGDLNAIAVHPYRGQSPETLVFSVTNLQRMLERNLGKIYPLWLTEWGYSSTQWEQGGFDLKDGFASDFRQRQANYTLRQMLAQWWLDIPTIVHYSLKDRGNSRIDNEQNYGLLDNAEKDKPSMLVMKQFTNHAKNYLLKGALEDLPFGLHAVVFESTDNLKNKALILWQSEVGANTVVRVPAAKFAKVQNMGGERVAVKLDQGDYLLEVSELEGPIYLILK